MLNLLLCEAEARGWGEGFKRANEIREGEGQRLFAKGRELGFVEGLEVARHEPRPEQLAEPQSEAPEESQVTYFMI